MSGRKPRRPRWPANPKAMAYAIRQASLISREELLSVLGPLKAAYTALREGVATEWQWQVICGAMNCAQAIERQGVVKGLREHFHAAELALAGIKRRALDAGEWRPTSLYYLELDAISTAIELHEFQLKNLSRGEVVRAIDYAQAEIRNTGGLVLKHPAACPA